MCRLVEGEYNRFHRTAGQLRPERFRISPARGFEVIGSYIRATNISVDGDSLARGRRGFRLERMYVARTDS